MMRLDVLAILVILADIMVSSFVIWRATSKKATLWGTARGIYWWVAVLSLYHCGIYIYTLFCPVASESFIIYTFLHPFVILYIINPLLIAIIHYRGGHLI